MVLVTADLMCGAHHSVPAVFRDMPQLVSEPLSERIGSPVVADLARRGEVGERRGVIVASAGNFGQGVAYACRAFGARSRHDPLLESRPRHTLAPSPLS